MKGNNAQLTYHDLSAGLPDTPILIPAGRYYFTHGTSSLDLVSVLNTLLNTAFPGAGVELTTGGRQVQFTTQAAGDYLNLVDTDDEDSIKIARMLGLYDNSGDLTYFESSNITDGWIAQNTLSSWFTMGGTTWRNYDLNGFEEFNNEIYQVSDGNTSQIGGEPVAKLPLELTVIDGNSIRGGLPFGTQAALGVTENDDWTTSLQQASNGKYQSTTFYAELNGETHTYALTKRIEASDARQIKPGWYQHQNLRS